jgi:DNA-binding NtrC family response regulator
MMQDKKTLMVIEDDQETLVMYKTVLEESGYHVLACESGVKAMSLLDNGKVSLILTDIRMPDVDMNHLLGYLNLHYPKIPVIVATAYAEYSYLLKKPGSTVKAFFLKPLDFEKLKKSIALTIHRHP